MAAVALVAVLGTGVAAALAPDGGPSVGTVTAAAVQGGGVRGFAKSQVDPAVVLAAAVAATDQLALRTAGRPLGLVLWPEDVVSLDGPLDGSPEESALSDLARRLGSTLVVGVTETTSATAFRNEVVAFGPDGTVVSRYEKVHRVPFGEYVPYRSFFAHLGNLSAVPRDAVPGTGPGLLTTPAGPLGAMISYEVFYAGRGRAPVRAGAQLLIVPTNTSSYATGQIPTQEIAASEVQAVQQGRDLLQAAPTGFSAWITHRGVAGRPFDARRAPDRPRRAAPPDRPHAVRAVRRRARPGGLDRRPRRRVVARRPGPVAPLLVVAGVDVHAGDPHGVEHGEIVGVVLEGEAQVEPEFPELVDRVPLVPGHLGVVAP